MSGFISDIATLAQQTVSLTPVRGIIADSLVLLPDCVIEERGSDRLALTDSPVEQSADITDHAYKLPADIILRYGWSNSSPANALTSGTIFGFGSETYAKDVYQQLLTLQAARQPVGLVTGKRNYDKVMIIGVDQTTDVKSEYGLVVVVTCRQINLVTTQSVKVAPSPSQAQAPNVTPPSNAGTQTPTQKPAMPSLLKQGYSFLSGAS